jgi:hypothetical protein
MMVNATEGDGGLWVLESLQVLSATGAETVRLYAASCDAENASLPRSDLDRTVAGRPGSL